MSKSPNRSVRLAERQWTWLEAESGRLGGISTNEILRRLVDEAIERQRGAIAKARAETTREDVKLPERS